MKNTFGQSVSVTLFGESHGPAVGAVLDGIAPGIEVDEQKIARQLSRRRPTALTDTARVEPDHFQILSGVFRGKTTGTPLCITIPNENTQSKDYTYGVARPSHADYSGFCKYHGYEDYRGGGHFSGRITAPLVALGGILLPALERLGICVGTHILECGGVRDRSFQDETADIALLKDRTFPVLSLSRGELMEQKILDARAAGDSLGGLTQTAVTGLCSGLGEPWFDSMESLLSHAVFGIGGVKGISFGDGFGFSSMLGSDANDAFSMRDGKVVTKTNRNGGINGGITNGMPVLFQCAVKPTPSISKEQKTVNFATGEDINFSVRGRHDPSIIRRICPVLDSVTSIVLCDVLASRYGTDVLRKGVSP